MEVMTIKEPIVPLGISPCLYFEEKIILDGSSLREDADPLLFLAHLYGKGDIPESVKAFLHEVQITPLVNRDCT
jgi:hypothetical protein